jgi:hypothetical protein
MIEEAQKSQVINNVALLSELVDRLNLIRTRDRVGHLGPILVKPTLRYDEVLVQLNIIREAVLQTILDDTEKSARAATHGMPRGPIKDAMQAFYNGAVGQLHGFKDTYRNVVMHVRRSYDELDALRAINLVREFMNGLSVKVGEKTRGPISRWP